MAVRQYIGARYVPKFFENPDGSNDWMTGIPYEALTVVTYAGTQFISKKPVPANAGTPNVESEYWVVSSTGCGGNLQPVLDDINDIKQEISELKEQKKDKYIFLFDSYGLYTDNENHSILNNIAIGLNLQPDEYYSFTKGGCGFSISNNTFKMLLEDNESSIANKDEITKIFVFGGANDQTYNTQPPIENGIKEFNEYVKSKYINAEIYIAALSKSWANVWVNVANMIKAYSNCGQFNCYYIANSHCIMQRASQFQSDMVHPTKNAVKEISNYIITGIKTKTCDVCYQYNLGAEINPSSQWVTQKQATLTNGDKTVIKYNNGNSQITGTGGGLLFKINFGTTLNFTSGTIVPDIIITHDSTFKNVENNDKAIPFVATITYETNQRIMGTGFLYQSSVNNNGAKWGCILYLPVNNLSNISDISFMGSAQLFMY